MANPTDPKKPWRYKRSDSPDTFHATEQDAKDFQTKAKELKYDYAITIDSDGQHFPDDIPLFLDALELENNPVVLIGSRNMNQDSVPKKSSFGNKFSNFWFIIKI